MIPLPRGLSVATGLVASHQDVPHFLGQLAQRQFTGYARFVFGASEVLLVFTGGKLTTVLATRGEARLTGLEAIAELCQRVAVEAGTIDVYQLGPELAARVSGVLQGEYHVRAQELKSVEVTALVAKIKARKLNGCVAIYTPQRCSLVFYRDGVGFGFFHDGSQAIETGATDSQKIAGQPGAKMDVMSTRPLEQLPATDFLEVVNVQKVWEAAVRANQARADELRATARAAERQRQESKLTELAEALHVIAAKTLGPMGRQMMTKELAARGGPGFLLHPDQVAEALAALEKGARLVAGPSKLKELTTQLKAEIDRQLAPPQSPLP